MVGAKSSPLPQVPTYEAYSDSLNTVSEEKARSKLPTEEVKSRSASPSFYKMDTVEDSTSEMGPPDVSNESQEGCVSAE